MQPSILLAFASVQPDWDLERSIVNDSKIIVFRDQMRESLDLGIFVWIFEL